MYYYVDSTGEIYTERSFPLIIPGEHEVGEREYLMARAKERIRENAKAESFSGSSYKLCA